MSRIVPVLIALLLVVAAPASAKEIGRVTMCGAGGCTDVSDEATHAVLEGGSPTGATARDSEPHFRMRVQVMEGKRVLDTFRTRWFPERRLLESVGYWMRASSTTQVELERLSAGLEPLGRSAAVAKGTGRGEAGGGTSALAIGAPAAAVCGAAALLALRRRRRR